MFPCIKGCHSTTHDKHLSAFVHTANTIQNTHTQMHHCTRLCNVKPNACYPSFHSPSFSLVMLQLLCYSRHVRYSTAVTVRYCTTLTYQPFMNTKLAIVQHYYIYNNTHTHLAFSIHSTVHFARYKLRVISSTYRQ